ncbi:MAG: energy transducer TonB [Carboxylicivirga sp.]|jgi:protein TonB|nr:energy transducer TonB [Carboxylicivirga sp.]
MEVKKNKKADLERKRALFFQIGLIVTLGLILLAFEWTTTDPTINTSLIDDEEVLEEEAPPITRHQEIQPPPPPQQAIDLLQIVDNDVELDEELEIEDVEMDEDYEVDLSDFDFGDDEETGDQIFMVVEEMPEFPGGTRALLKYIAQNVKYPVICQENGIQGMVSVSFVINEKGEVTNVKAFRGTDANLEQEAVRVVKSLPNWKPGKQRGKAVKVSYNVPVRFKLQ